MTPTLRDNNGNMAVFMKTKGVLVRKSAFLKPSKNLGESLVISAGLAHTKITKEVVA